MNQIKEKKIYTPTKILFLFFSLQTLKGTHTPTHSHIPTPTRTWNAQFDLIATRLFFALSKWDMLHEENVIY